METRSEVGRYVRWRVSLRLLLPFLTIVAQPASAHAATAVRNPSVSATPACFVVHNPGDSSLPLATVPAAVKGTRFEASNSNRSRVVVPVHGVNTWSRFWDLRPSFSIARKLAAEGFLVFAYDLLGTGNSTYPYPLRSTLTVGGQQVMLHEIIEQLRGRSVLRLGEPNPCAGSSPLGVGRRPMVALVGHSAGTFLVQGYPGMYHGADPGRVNAIVLASIPLCPGLGSPCAQTYLHRTERNQGQEVSFFLDDGAYQPYLAARSVLPRPCHPMFLLCVGGTVSGTLSPPTGQCKVDIDFLVWEQATASDADLGDVCDPAGIETWPSAEWDNPGITDITHRLPLGALASGDLSNAPRGFPVLFTWTDHDGFDASDTRFDPANEQANQAAEVRAAKQASRANISSWTQQDAGHAIELAATMPAWVSEVADWLHASGSEARRFPGHRSPPDRQR
jgi:pimeloyl-ACP methyl ester carboxylesterase